MFASLRSRATTSHCPVCDGVLLSRGPDAESRQCPTCTASLIPARTSGVPARVLATAIDTAIVAVIGGPIAWLSARGQHLEPVLRGRSVLDGVLRIGELSLPNLAVRLFPVALVAALYLGLFWVLRGRTPAQALVGLRIVTKYGQKPGPLRALARIAVAMVGLACGGLGWLWAAFDLERRAWHDRLVGTWVVRDV